MGKDLGVAGDGSVRDYVGDGHRLGRLGGDVEVGLEEDAGSSIVDLDADVSVALVGVEPDEEEVLLAEELCEGREEVQIFSAGRRGADPVKASYGVLGKDLRVEPGDEVQLLLVNHRHARRVHREGKVVTVRQLTGTGRVENSESRSGGGGEREAGEVVRHRDDGELGKEEEEEEEEGEAG